MMYLSPDERKVHVCMVLEHFQLYGILNNPTKCVLGVGELQFLGYHDNQHGMSPPADQVQVIWEFPKPTTVRQLQEFLGLVNFHWFVAQCAQILNPYTQCSKQPHPTSVSYSGLQKLLLPYCPGNASLLVHPKPDASVKLMRHSHRWHTVPTSLLFQKVDTIRANV